MFLFQQQQKEIETYRYKVATGLYGEDLPEKVRKKHYKKNEYFSDEEELSEQFISFLDSHVNKFYIF